MRRHPLFLSVALVCLSTAPAALASDASNELLRQADAALRIHQGTRAATLLQQAAARGDRDAQSLLGLLYLAGIGVEADRAAAQRWLRSAAERGNAEAAFVLASLLPPDEARGWLQRSAALGYARAREALRDPQPLLASLRPTDEQAVAAWTIYCARHNDAAALLALGPAATRVRDEFGRDALSRAAQAGAAAAVDTLLKLGADPRSADHYGETALMLAARRGDTPLTQRLLHAGAVVTQADQAGRTALMYAVRSGALSTAQALLMAGAPVNAADVLDSTPLDLALSQGSEPMAALLREHGGRGQPAPGPASEQATHAATDRPGERYRGWSPLAIAISRNDASLAQAALQAGGTLNQRTPQGDPPWRIAIDAHASDLLGWLIRSGADPLLSAHDGHTALVYSAENDAVALAALLRAGVSPEVHATDEPPPLVAAIRAGPPESAPLLLAAGARVDVTDSAGRTPLMLAVSQNRQEIIAAAIARHASVDQRDRAGHSALWYAAQSGNEQAIATLIAAHVSVDSADDQGLTPLAVAAAAGQFGAERQLLAAGANPDTADHDGDTPLILAAAGGHVDVAELLLSRGVPLDSQNRVGDTALQLASRNGQESLCLTLVQAGASQAVRNRAHQTAGDIALSRGFTSLAERLSAH
jgi:ankyrin repeat protein